MTNDAPQSQPISPALPPPYAALAGRPAPAVEPIQRLEHTRTVFWQNVVREMLVALPGLASRHPQIMDGRIALLTRGGERIPVAGVEPLFPCSIAAPETIQLCMAVQCTVFNILTPTGEVFTLPLEEIRSIHTLTDELIREIERAVESGSDEGGSEPFGFAAFTSLARQAKGEDRTTLASDQPAI